VGARWAATWRWTRARHYLDRHVPTADTCHGCSHTEPASPSYRPLNQRTREFGIHRANRRLARGPMVHAERTRRISVAGDDALRDCHTPDRSATNRAGGSRCRLPTGDFSQGH
jgi:hypothetical protein